MFAVDNVNERAAFLRQADACRRLGSPFTSLIMTLLAERLDRTTATGRRILDWQGDTGPAGASVPLRLAGALHALVRAGRSPDLAAHYPPNACPEPSTLMSELSRTLAAHHGWIATFLNNPPQTNEIGRSSLLYAGLITISHLTSLPLSLFEIGSSAGLNLAPERFRYTFGDYEGGDKASPVHLAPTWKGPAPVGAAPRIVARRGCDQAPLDHRNAEASERLMAYIWPDQPERLQRTESAIMMMAADPPQIDRADAADWVECHMAAIASPGTARVLMHSITMNYLPSAAQQRIRAAVIQAGESARLDTPLAWLSFEQERPHAALRLRLWPQGIDCLLATADPHGWSIDWKWGIP